MSPYFKGKCKEFEQKIKNHDGKLMTVAAVAGAATTIFGCYKLAATIGRDVKKAKQDVSEMTGEAYNNLKAYIGKEKAEGRPRRSALSLIEIIAYFGLCFWMMMFEIL